MGGAASLQLAGPAASSQPNGGGRIHQNSTLYQHSKNQQLHQNHLYIEFRFDFWGPIYYPAVQMWRTWSLCGAPCNVSDAESQGPGSARCTHLCMGRTVNTVNTAPPKLGSRTFPNNQGAIYSMKQNHRQVRKCLGFWPMAHAFKFHQVSNRILRQTDIEPGDSAATWTETSDEKKAAHGKFLMVWYGGWCGCEI